MKGQKCHIPRRQRCGLSADLHCSCRKRDYCEPPEDEELPSELGGRGAFDGGAGVFEGGTGVFDGGTGVLDGGTGILEGGAGTLDGGAGMLDGGGAAGAAGAATAAAAAAACPAARLTPTKLTSAIAVAIAATPEPTADLVKRIAASTRWVTGEPMLARYRAARCQIGAHGVVGEHLRETAWARVDR